MKAVVQRVGKASVTTEQKVIGNIGKGLVVLIAISKNDTIENADKMVDKIINLRIFEDNNGKMNLSCIDVGGEILVISQFTLYGDCRKGRRPSYDMAGPPEAAEQLYNYFVRKIKEYPLKIETGVFGAMMSVYIVNEGPVTLIIET